MIFVIMYVLSQSVSLGRLNYLINLVSSGAITNWNTLKLSLTPYIEYMQRYNTDYNTILADYNRIGTYG